MTGPEYLERPGVGQEGRQTMDIWGHSPASTLDFGDTGTWQVAWGGPSGVLPALWCVVYRSAENKAFSSPLGPAF